MLNCGNKKWNAVSKCWKCQHRKSSKNVKNVKNKNLKKMKILQSFKNIEMLLKQMLKKNQHYKMVEKLSTN